MNRTKGFTLIELLVVIAIIGILAGIIFPVFAQAKKNGYKSSDISSMNAIRNALQLYKVDQGGYPPALLGYATQYASDAQTLSNIIPANQVQGAIFPKRIDSLATLNPANNRDFSVGKAADLITGTYAVWPAGSTNSAAGQPLQRFGPETRVQHCYPDGPGDATYYGISGYDVANVRTSNGPRTEIHYSPFWSGWTVAANPCAPGVNETGSAQDDPRQLGYSDPPETTVVTWNSFYRDYDGAGNPQRIKSELVLFLGGSARPYDSAAVAASAWQIRP